MHLMPESNFENAMDPELRAVFRTLPPIYTDVMFDDLATARSVNQQVAEAFRQPVPEDIRVEERYIPGPVGAPEVHLRIYRPQPSSPDALPTPSALPPQPALLWVHSGAFVLNNLDLEEPLYFDFSRTANCVVTSVDWRLPPEDPFPAGVEDCYIALKWIVEQAGELGVDPKRVAIGGLSAGAGLCVALALMARDRGGPGPCFQMLLEACLDDRHSTPSSYEVTDPRVWNRAASLRAWKMYLANVDPQDVPSYAAPGRARDLSGLPPAYLLSGQLDLLRDEIIEYGNRLMKANVPTELHIYPGAFHGFGAIPTATISQDYRADRVAALKRALGS